MPWSVSKIFAAKVPIKPSEMLFELIWYLGCCQMRGVDSFLWRFLCIEG